MGGLGQPPQSTVMSEHIAHPPVQVCMEQFCDTSQDMQHESSFKTAWPYTADWATTRAVTRPDSERLTMEHLPGNDADPWGTSRSALRRRRRQRAAERAEASGEQEAEPSEEQSLELLEQVRVGGEAQRTAVARFRRLTFSNQDSCRVAQLVLEEASPSEAGILLKALRGNVREASKSMFANYVLQRAVELLPNESTSFIAQELIGIGSEVARHRFGCRVLCRLIEHGSLEESSKRSLLEEVLSDTDALSRDEYGNFVIRHCLEFGHPYHQHLIAAAVCPNLIEMAMDQNGSHVVESAVQFCETADKKAIADKILADSGQVLCLATDSYGRHVVKALLRAPGEWQELVAAALRPSIRTLKQSGQGKPVLQALQAWEGKRS